MYMPYLIQCSKIFTECGSFRTHFPQESQISQTCYFIISEEMHLNCTIYAYNNTKYIEMKAYTLSSGKAWKNRSKFNQISPKMELISLISSHSPHYKTFK